MSLLRRTAYELDSIRLSALSRTRSRHTNDPLVLLLGTGRGGTTATMNMLRAGLGAACLWEPLRPESSRRAARLTPPHQYPQLARGQRDDGMAEYMDDVIARRSVSRWSTSRSSLSELRTRPALVIKEVRANRMAGWLQERYPDAYMRVLLRHPLPVVNSMLRAPLGWSEMSWDLLVPPAAEALGCEARELASPSDPRELHMFAVWIADTVRVLQDLVADNRTALDFYESLRSEPTRTIRRAGSGLSGFDETAALSAVSTPSDTASAQLDLGRTEQLPTVAPAVVTRIRELLDQFGVRCYDPGDIRPRPEALPHGLRRS